jgi:hypothetical protein
MYNFGKNESDSSSLLIFLKNKIAEKFQMAVPVKSECFSFDARMTEDSCCYRIEQQTTHPVKK